MGQILVTGDRLSRSETAKLLDVSTSTVRRMEIQGMLHPVVDEKGTHRFGRDEVESLARARGVETGPERGAGRSQEPFQGQGGALVEGSAAHGEVSARAFELFEQEKSPEQVVIELKVSPAIVQNLHSAWAAMRCSLILSNEERLEIERIVGTKLRQEGFAEFVKTLAVIFQAVKSYTFRCKRCGKLATINPTIWKKIFESGILDDVTCPRCSR